MRASLLCYRVSRRASGSGSSFSVTLTLALALTRTLTLTITLTLTSGSGSSFSVTSCHSVGRRSSLSVPGEEEARVEGPGHGRVAWALAVRRLVRLEVSEARG